MNKRRHDAALKYLYSLSKLLREELQDEVKNPSPAFDEGIRVNETSTFLANINGAIEYMEVYEE